MRCVVILLKCFYVLNLRNDTKKRTVIAIKLLLLRDMPENVQLRVLNKEGLEENVLWVTSEIKYEY